MQTEEMNMARGFYSTRLHWYFYSKTFVRFHEYIIAFTPFPVLCVWGRGRGSEGETDRQTDRQTDSLLLSLFNVMLIDF